MYCNGSIFNEIDFRYEEIYIFFYLCYLFFNVPMQYFFFNLGDILFSGHFHMLKIFQQNYFLMFCF